MARMIVTDLDGTLLRDDKTVSGYTLHVVENLRRAGVLFVVATARPVRAVAEWLPFIKYDAGIFHNGAVIRTPVGDIGGMGIAESGIVARSILAAMPDACISVESEDRLYCNYDSNRVWPGAEFTFTRDFACVADKVAEKLIVAAHSHADVERLAPLLPDYTYAQLSENRIAMIMNRRATKINAVRVLAEKYGIAMSDVVAFGDDYNDIDMLKGCGRGIAVKNALDEVKAAADEVCASNMDDGVAGWIAENVLKAVTRTEIDEEEAHFMDRCAAGDNPCG